MRFEEVQVSVLRTLQEMFEAGIELWSVCGLTCGLLPPSCEGHLERERERESVCVCACE